MQTVNEIILGQMPAEICEAAKVDGVPVPASPDFLPAIAAELGDDEA